MIDTHCHIISKFHYTDTDAVIKRAQAAGVNKMICIGCDFEDITQTLELTDKNPGVVFASLGLHPECVKEDSNVENIYKELEKIVLENQDKIFAIGECGLDYHYTQNKNIHVMQQKLFKLQIELSIKINKPLVIHTRDAWDDTFMILEELDIKNRKTSQHVIEDKNNFPNQDIVLTSGIIHSFTGGIPEAKKSLDLGFKLGINGIVTFKNKNLDSLRDAVKFAGKENIVFETDSPFLTPDPYRGQTNEPARIKEIADYVEKLLG